MKIWGKLAGFFAGIILFRGHPLALLICIALGHWWDRHAEGERLREWSGGDGPTASWSFLAPLFGLAGAIAKSDGRVSEAEIAATEQLMTRMQLSGQQRAAAISQFNAGKQPGYALDETIAQLRSWCGRRTDRAFVLADLLLDIVCAEGPLVPDKLAIVRRLCAALGLSENMFAALAAMKGYAWAAPGAGRRDYSGRQAPRDAASGKDPYAVLGIAREANDAQVKRAYRKLMSQHHPDKLGDVPEELKRRAEERAREINAAYEKIRAERHFV